jgi:uncharacterized protein (DUF1800 family)
VSLAPKSSFTADDVGHLLSRTRFAPSPADVAAVQQMGVPSFVNQMLVMGVDTPTEQAAMAEFEDPAFPSQEEIARWWIRMMVDNPNAFQEVLGMFWHDHFAASQEILEGDQAYWMRAHVNLWRHDGAGNLRTLLGKMAADWMMLQWLDGVKSTRRAPNENFAREFWELFTLGVDNGYLQADIVQAAKCFTGYRTRFDDVTTQQRFVEFDPTRHDSTDKSILGLTVTGRTGVDGALEYQDMVDLTLDNRPSAEFFAKKIFEGFCYLDPPAEVVDALAAALRGSNYDLAPVFSMLFRSEAFYSDRSKQGLVKSPVEFALGFVRATNLQVPMDDLDDGVAAAGQRPTMPPNVNGWPGGTLWLSSQSMIERANFVRECITHRELQTQLGVDVASLLPPPGQRSAGEVVDALATLLRVPLSTAERDLCVTYLDTQRQSNGTVVASPFDATNPTHVDERVRGLLYVLAQHPAYHVR